MLIYCWEAFTDQTWECVCYLSTVCPPLHTVSLPWPGRWSVPVATSCPEVQIPPSGALHWSVFQMESYPKVYLIAKKFLTWFYVVMSVDNKVMSLHVHACIHVWKCYYQKAPLNRWYCMNLLTTDNNEFKWIQIIFLLN